MPAPALQDVFRRLRGVGNPLELKDGKERAQAWATFLVLAGSRGEQAALRPALASSE